MPDVPSEARAKVTDLAERFGRNLDQYRRGEYKEAEVRQEFIDPVFDALGWDVRNRGGYAEAYKDVVHEESLRVAAGIEAPDYTFRIGGTRKFFVEAKKPSVSVRTDVGPAYQLRRYAWSGKLPLSILTDFEEFAVYDCTRRPNANDKASVGRVAFYTFDQYSDVLPAIWDTFAKESVLRGSFDRYVESTKGKRGTGEVDDEILREIEGWRDSLAHNLALRNPGIRVDELNFAVQATIDRILFLRVAEDRGIEDYARLQALLNGANIYLRLGELFEQADRRYNAGLFDFRADALSLRLQLDDKVLKDILARLYYPDSPYEFSVIPVEILGQVYEQFLGKVIRLTPGHQAKVEEKPEVKKAGGVYYTPKYIVDYIVQHTVGELVKGKSPAELAGNGPSPQSTQRAQRISKKTSAVSALSALKSSPLRVLDPACGSGSFLLGAYQYLLLHCLTWYVAHDPDKWAASREPPIRRGGNGDWKLTIAERKRILVTHIFGVDIDRQAVEVTKLSLLLKVLEGESQETLGQQLRLFQERALPNLDHNIQCGNSLIGPDYWEGRLAMDPDEARRINAFDWHANFPQAMAAGGFDAVIGNPPYVFTREQLGVDERRYFSAAYEATWEKHNTFMLFMELMLRLLRANGKGSFIVPNSWLTIESARLLRGLFIPHMEILADLNYTVFERVSMEPCIFVITGAGATTAVLTLRARSREAFERAKPFDTNRDRWTGEDRRITFSEHSGFRYLSDRLASASRALGEVFEVRSGLQAYERGRGTPPQTEADVTNHVFDRPRREDRDSWRYLQGGDVARYTLRPSGMWMQYGPWLSQPRGRAIFSRPRVLLREITADLPYCLHAVFADAAFLNNKSILNLLHPRNDRDELKLLLGILNSRSMSLYYSQRGVKSARRIFPKVVVRNVREFPYPDTSDPGLRQRLVALVDRMLDLHKRQVAARTPADREMYASQIAATDKEIDALVYELYGLTEDEIAVVEGVTLQGQKD